MDSLEDKNLKYFYSTENKTFSDTYNKCAELATNPYIVFCHNDIVVAPGFLENIEKYAQKDRVISYTTVEPPIFKDHQRPGKIIPGVWLFFFNIILPFNTISINPITPWF